MRNRSSQSITHASLLSDTSLIGFAVFVPIVYRALHWHMKTCPSNVMATLSKWPEVFLAKPTCDQNLVPTEISFHLVNLISNLNRAIKGLVE